MSVLDWFRKGFGYMLLTMGVSRPRQKPKPAAPPVGDGSDQSDQCVRKPEGTPPQR